MTDTDKLIEREIRNAREGADYLRVAASRLDRLYDPEGVAKQHNAWWDACALRWKLLSPVAA